MKNKLEILKHPAVMILSMIIGILTGVFFKKLSLHMSIFGDIYLALLNMCSIPIVITAIIPSIAKLFQSHEVKKYLFKIITVFSILIFFTGIFSFSFTMVCKPGHNIGKKAEIVIGKLISKTNIKSSKDLSNKDESVKRLFYNMIPENIFNSLSKGYMLQIVFFTIILGVATGFLPERNYNTIIELTESFFEAFFKIIDWLIYLLPFGIISLLAKQMTQIGTGILLAMLKFIIVFHIISILLMLKSGFLIKIYGKVNFKDSFLKLRDALFIGFGTQSSIAAIPSTIEGLTEGLKNDKKITNLVLPIGIVIFRFSAVIIYTTSVIFAANLYNMHFNVTNTIISIFLCIVIAVSSAGLPGLTTMAMVGNILHYLGLPVETVVVLLIAVTPLIDPICTAATIHLNSAATVIIAHKK